MNPAMLERIVQDREAASFIDKWLQAEPEMAVGLTLIPVAERRLAALWGALLNEIYEATLLLSDAGVAQAKLSWWGHALSQEGVASEHPLLRALFSEPAVAEIPAQDWAHALHAAIELATLDNAPADVDAVFAARLPLAEGIAALETRLWPSQPPHAPDIAVALVLRQWREVVAGDTPRPAFVPLQLLARHDLRMQALHDDPQAQAARALFADLSQALGGTRSAAAQGSRLRRVRGRFDAQLLQRLARRVDAPFRLPRLASLWWAWRSAASLPAPDRMKN